MTGVGCIPEGELDLTKFNSVRLAFKLGENKKH